jgi:hypothetical protein
MIALFPVVPSLCSQYVPSLSLFFSWLFPVFPVKTHTRACVECVWGERGDTNTYMALIGIGWEHWEQTYNYLWNQLLTRKTRLGTDWEQTGNTGNRLGTDWGLRGPGCGDFTVGLLSDDTQA